MEKIKIKNAKLLGDNIFDQIFWMNQYMKDDFLLYRLFDFAE